MTAVDTNLLVRLLTGDDAGQQSTARSVFASGPIWIPKTVVLELNWVLQSTYGYSDFAVREAIDRILGLPNVYAEDETGLADALALTVHGVGLADALHLTSRPPDAEFVSFDRTFVRRAKRAGVSEIFDVATFLSR